MFIKNVGNYPLTGITVRPLTQEGWLDPTRTAELEIGTLNAHDDRPMRMSLTPHIEDRTGISSDHFEISAQNFTVSEWLQIRKGKRYRPWAYKYTVWKFNLQLKPYYSHMGEIVADVPWSDEIPHGEDRYDLRLKQP